MIPKRGGTLRLMWPQWQGAAPATIGGLLPDLPHHAAALGYHVGSRILGMVAPQADGPTAVVPVSLDGDGLGVTDGMYAREPILAQLRAALAILDAHQPDRVVTLGGECSVSVAPFTYLASPYGDDLAVVWIDAHPDTGMPRCANVGYHAMAVSHILGHGDPQVLAALPARVDASRVVLAGLHRWDPDQEPFTTGWGLATIHPDALDAGSRPLLDWLRSTGCSRVAVHLDVDSIDGDEVAFGLGVEPGGLRSDTVVRMLADVAEVADVVALTVAEYIPRQVLAMQRLLGRLPLLGGS